MKPKVVLISHGHYAEQTYESAKMVVGEIVGLHVITMLADDGLEGTRGKLEAVMSAINETDPVLIITDVFFGTPCNTAVEAMYKNDNIRVLTGLNLPMIIEYAVSAIEDLDEMAGYLKEVGISSIKIVEKENNDISEGEGYED